MRLKATCAQPYLFDTFAAHEGVGPIGRTRRSTQHGYVTTRDARDLDIDPAQLRLMAARGRLERAGRGVYRVPILPLSEHDDLAAALAWSLGRGVVSHESALVLHGLSDVNPSRIHLTVPRRTTRALQVARCTARIVATSCLSDITQVDSLPLTTVARTIRDCMATGTDPYQLRLAIDRAERDGTLRRTVATELRAELDAAGAHWPGRAR